MKKVFAYLINFLLIGAAATGAGITIYNVINNDAFSKDIYLTKDGIKVDSWNINITGIFPGQKLQYEVNFLNENNEPYDITMSFAKGAKTELAQYINLKIKFGKEEISSGLLESYFTTEKFDFKDNIENTKLKLIYEMPVEVGNEAQKLVADFSVDIAVDSKGVN